MASLDRFRKAQDSAGTYQRALAELRDGAKRSHWMWFVFPQLAGLGRSEMAQRYAITSLQEARDYLADPVLGARLRECAATMLQSSSADAEAILGPVDAVKLRSSMTLFAHADPGASVFSSVLDRFFGGEEDERTLALLRFRS